MREPATTPAGRYIDVGWFMDYIGSVQIVYMDGRVTDDSFNRYMTAFCDEIDYRPDDASIAVFYHLPTPSAVDSGRRAKLASALKEREAKLAATSDAFVMVTSSPIVRYALKAMFWIAPPPYHNDVTSTTLDGFHFIARHHKGPDPVELNNTYEQLLKQASPGMAAG